MNRVAVPGSSKRSIPEFDHLTSIVPGDQFNVSVRLRRRSALGAAPHAHRKPVDRVYLTHDEHASRHGAHDEDMRAVEAFAHGKGIQVVLKQAAQRQIVLRGTASAFHSAFGVELRSAFHNGKHYRVRRGEIFVPPDLSEIITSVTGLDNRPFAKPHFRVGRAMARAAGAHAFTSDVLPPGTAFSPVEIASLYDFPPGLDGTGQTIAILELGGGFRQIELESYFTGLGVRRPNVSVASFPTGGANTPGSNALDPFSCDNEVMLDIQIAGAIAPGATIVVYFAPDASDESFLGAMSAIIHDTVNNPGIVSISWGGPEELATEQFRNEFDRMLQSAAHLGITVCVATGDNGSADFAADDPRWNGGAHVDFPASSPYALACGGTRISVANGKLEAEDVWHEGPNDGTGGGISRFFALPDYQAKAGVPRAANPDGAVMRGIPDVAGNASPASGYRILCNGQRFPDPEQGVPALGGTSAVAPLWAALVALMNQSLGKRCGFLNPLLYEAAAAKQAVFRNITSGTNGSYSAGPGWDPCTGLGSPQGISLLEALRGETL